MTDIKLDNGILETLMSCSSSTTDTLLTSTSTSTTTTTTATTSSLTKTGSPVQARGVTAPLILQRLPGTTPLSL